MSTLPQNISSLSVAEKCELLDALWEDLETQGALSEEQSAELDRRVAAYEENPSAVVPWEQVSPAAEVVTLPSFWLVGFMCRAFSALSGWARLTRPSA